MKAKSKSKLPWIVLVLLLIGVICVGAKFAYQLFAPYVSHYIEQHTEQKEQKSVAKTGTYYVYGGAHGLPMHEEPSQYSKVKKAIPNKSEVEILYKSKRGYYKVRFGKKDGYVKGKYLLKRSEEPSERLKEQLREEYPLYYVVNCQGYTNLYYGRNAEKVLLKVPYGYRVRVLGEVRKGFYRVAFRNRIGYISSEQLSKFKHE